MADWAAFTGVTFVVLSLLLLLSRATRTAMTDEGGSIEPPTEGRDLLRRDAERASAETCSDSIRRGGSVVRDGSMPRGGSTRHAGSAERTESPPDAAETPTGGRDDGSLDTDAAAAGTPRADDPDAKSEPTAARRENGNPHNPFPPGSPSHETLSPDDDPEFSTGALLANVALSQGLFGSLLLAAAWYTGVPASAFGVGPAPLSTGWPALAVGVAAGVVLYGANEAAASALDRAGVESNEELRELLAPDSNAEWAVLLGAVLPVIAAFEEFLFRAAVVGAVSAGFAVSPWAMAVVSTAAFALGHGMQGPGGVAVTGTLGFVLAALFIVTGSFLAVVVAHYLVNALEFVVHEGLDADWGRTAG